MESAKERYRRLLTKGESTDRIEFFSDAVFAIAMTLLVLDIRLPEVDGADLGEALNQLVPKYFAYVLSFVIIAVNWISHHRKFTVTTGYDATLVRLNLLLLLLVAFVPFPTSVLSGYGPQTPAVVLYAATVGGIGVVQYLLWAHVRRAGLLDPVVDLGVYRLVRVSVLTPPAVFLLSIIVALIGQPLIAMLVWLLIGPATAIAGRAASTRPDDRLPAVSSGLSGTD